MGVTRSSGSPAAAQGLTMTWQELLVLWLNNPSDRLAVLLS